MSESLTIQQVSALEQKRERTIWNWLKKGKLWRTEDGLIDSSSLSQRARERQLKKALHEAAEASHTPQQHSLFLADSIVALKIPEQQKPVVQLREELVLQCINGNFKAHGFRRKRDFVYALAMKHGMNGRSLERWTEKYVKTIPAVGMRGDPSVLCDRKRGPVASDPRAIEDWSGPLLCNWYERYKLNYRQCHERLKEEIQRKQAAWGVTDLYPVPSYDDVRRFLHRRHPICESIRNGPDALKASLGYIDRTYRDIHSLSIIFTDEWIADILAYDPKMATKVGRYYLLTFLDARSLYPLTWLLVEHPNEDDEIELLLGLMQNYGVPGMISSDRGRFRGRTFGGRFMNSEREKMYSHRDGMLDRLGIRRNVPREHNPRGSRLERFHKELATWARTQPGWVGANVKTERKMAPGDRQQAEHMDWVRGRRNSTPLLSRDELLDSIGKFMITFREKPSNGNDMDGKSPARVFEDSKPRDGFRQVSEAELAWHTAEHFMDEVIERGGIITLPDKRRYEHPTLVLFQGQKREVVRLRTDRTFISVLPAAKGEETIFATQRVLVGNTDASALGEAHAKAARIRRAVEGYVQSHQPEIVERERVIIPRSSDAIPARDFFEVEIETESLKAADSRPLPTLYDNIDDDCAMETL